MADITVTDMPAQVYMDFYIGDTFTRDVTIRKDGALVDVSSDAFAMRFVDNRGTALLNLSVGSGISHVSTGKIRITLTASQTAAFSQNAEIRSDLEWTRASDSHVKTLFRTRGKAVSDITP